MVETRCFSRGTEDFRRSLSVGLVFVCLFLDNFLLYMFATIIEDVAGRARVPAHIAIFLYMIKPIVTFPCSLLCGHLVKSLGPYFTCSLGMACFFISCWIHAIAEPLYVWALARFFQALGSALTVGAGVYLLSHVTSERDRGKYMGIAYAGNGIGVFLGPLIGSSLFHSPAVGQFKLYASLSVLVLIQLVLCFRLRCLSPVVQHQSVTRTGDAMERQTSFRASFAVWKKLLCHKQMLCIMLSATAACGVVGIVEPLLPSLITHHHPYYTDQRRDRLWAMGAFFYPLMIVVSGFVSDRIPRHRVLQAGLLGFAVLLPMWTFAKNHIVSVVFYVALVFGFDAVVDAPVQPLIASVVDELNLGEEGVIAFTLGEVAQNFGHLFGPGLSIWLNTKLEHAGDDIQPFEAMLTKVQLVISGIFVAGCFLVFAGFRAKREKPRVAASDEPPSTPDLTA